MSSYAAAIELCKANVLFLNAGLDLKSADLNLITWEEDNALFAGIVTSSTTELNGGAPTINMLASGSTNLDPGASTSDDSLIREAIDAMLRDLQERIGQFAGALRIMPKQRMTAFLPKHYTGAIEGTGQWANEEARTNILKRMIPFRPRRESNLVQIRPDKWANIQEASDGIFTVDGKLVTRAQLSQEDEDHLVEFDQRSSLFWAPTRVVVVPNPPAGSDKGEGSGEVEGNQEE